MSALLDAPRVRERVDLLEARIEALMRQHALPGLALGVVHEQELVYARGFGQADLESGRAMTPETPHRIASHSKLFTAIALLQLRDAGRLQLDDPLARHLPWFALERPEGARAITLRHLLSHASGLPREAGSPYWVDFEFPDLASVKQRLSRLEAPFAPERVFKYSNLGLMLAGEVVSAVSGRPFRSYVREEIFEPLGMRATSFDAKAPDVATGYTRRDEDGRRRPLPPVDARSLDPATGVTSTVADMARFQAWQIRLRSAKSPELLHPETLREMQRVHWLHESWRFGWGLGFAVEHTRARDLCGHGGAYPGFCTASYVSLREPIGVIAFANAVAAPVYAGMPESVLDRVFDWLVPAILEAARPAAEPPGPLLDGVAGRYRGLFGDIQLGWLDGEVIAYDPESPLPLSEMARVRPDGSGVLRFQDHGMGARGERVTFEHDPEGRVVRLIIGDLPFERV